MYILNFLLSPFIYLIPVLLIPLISILVIMLHRKPQRTFISSLYANYQGTNEFELRIHEELRKNFGPNQVFLNYMFGRGDTSAQIDHIVLTKKAIFVIESKDYKGNIFADVHSQNWSQKLEYVKSTPSKYTSYSNYGTPYRRHYLKKYVDVHKLYNPVLQNEGHIKPIKYYLSDLNVPIVNMVVFSNRGKLVLNTFEAQDLFIIHETDLLYILKAYVDTRPNVLSEKELTHIENLLICLNTNTEENASEHINRLSKAFSNSKQKN